MKSIPVDILGAIDKNELVKVEMQDDWQMLEARIKGKNAETVEQILREQKTSWILCPKLSVNKDVLAW
jgi:hypothetical protein